mgnify:CR=1 FL=1
MELLFFTAPRPEKIGHRILMFIQATGNLVLPMLSYEKLPVACGWLYTTRQVKWIFISNRSKKRAEMVYNIMFSKSI